MEVNGLKLKLQQKPKKQSVEQELKSVKESHNIVSNELVKCKAVIGSISSDLRHTLTRHLTQKSNIPPARGKKEWQLLKQDIHAMVCILRDEVQDTKRENEKLKSDNLLLRKNQSVNKATPQTQPVAGGAHKDVRKDRLIDLQEAGTLANIQRERNDLQLEVEERKREVKLLNIQIQEKDDKCIEQERCFNDYVVQSEKEQESTKARIEKLQNENTVLRSVNDNMQPGLQGLRVSKGIAERELAELRQKLSQKETEMVAQRVKYDDRNKENEKKLQHYEAERSRTTQKIKEMDDEIRGNRKKIEDYKRNIADGQKDKDDIEKQSEQFAKAMQQQQSDLAKKVERISQLQTANDELRKDKKALKMKIQRLNEQLQESQSKVQPIEQKGYVTSESCELAELKSTLADREKANIELSNQMDEIKQALNTKETEYKDQLAEARKSMERLKEQLASVTQENKRLTTNIQKLQQEHVTAQKCDESFETEGPFSKHHEEMKVCQAQINTYLDQIAFKDADIEKLKRDINATQNKCKDLSKQVLDAEDNSNVVKKESQKQINELTKQNDQLEATNTVLMTKVRYQEEELKRAMNQSKIYESKIETMQQDWDKTKSLSKECEKKITELETNIDNLKHELNHEKHQSETHASKNTQLENQVEKMQRDLDNEKRQARKLATESDKDQREISDLKARIKYLNDFQKDQERKIDDIKKEVYRNGQNDGFEKGLMQTSQDTDKLNTSLAEEKKKKEEARKQLIQREQTLRQTIGDLQKERKANETNKTELGQAQQEIAQLKAKPNVPDNQYRIEELEQQLAIQESKFEHDIKVLQNDYTQLQEEHRALAAENTRNVNSLAAEMNAKVSSDESALENISIQARPMKIAEDYTLLMSNFWLDAKSALDDVKADDITEAGKIMFLFDILMICEQEAKIIHKRIVQELAKTLRNPLQRLVSCEVNGATAKEETQQQELELPQNILTVIGDYFRGLAHKVDLHQIRQRVETSLQTKYNSSEKDNTFTSTCLQLEDVTEFINESVGIAWKMALQRPPMVFDVSHIGQAWHKGSHLELLWGSEPNAENAVIQYYKGPTLLHAGNTMVKGSVFVHNYKNPK